MKGKRALLFVVLFTFFIMCGDALADCPSCFEFFGCKIITKDKKEITGYIQHNNYGYSGKSSPFEIKKRERVTIFKNYYDVSTLPFVNTLKELRPKLRWKFVFASKDDVVDLKTSEIESIIDQKSKSNLYGADTSLVTLSDKAIHLLIGQTPYAVYIIDGTDTTILSYNKQYDTMDKVKQLYWHYDSKFFGESEFTKATRVELEKKYQSITDLSRKRSLIDSDLFLIGYKQLIQELESNNLAYFKGKDPSC